VVLKAPKPNPLKTRNVEKNLQPFMLLLATLWVKCAQKHVPNLDIDCQAHMPAMIGLQSKSIQRYFTAGTALRCDRSSGASLYYSGL